jgi:hypothetical protein
LRSSLKASKFIRLFRILYTIHIHARPAASAS